MRLVAFRKRLKAVINERREYRMKKIKKKIDAMLIKRKCVSGVTVIEMVLILVIIIALLLIFKSQLISLINTIFDKVTSESAGI